jgi:hypothetical protein
MTQFAPASCYFLHLRPKYLSQHPNLRHPQPLFFPYLHTHLKSRQNYSSVNFNIYVFRYQNSMNRSSKIRLGHNCHILCDSYVLQQVFSETADVHSLLLRFMWNMMSACMPP